MRTPPLIMQDTVHGPSYIEKCTKLPLKWGLRSNQTLSFDRHCSIVWVIKQIKSSNRWFHSVGFGHGGPIATCTSPLATFVNGLKVAEQIRTPPLIRTLHNSVQKPPMKSWHLHAFTTVLYYLRTVMIKRKSYTWTNHINKIPMKWRTHITYWSRHLIPVPKAPSI